MFLNWSKTESDIRYPLSNIKLIYYERGRITRIADRHIPAVNLVGHLSWIEFHLIFDIALQEQRAWRGWAPCSLWSMLSVKHYYGIYDVKKIKIKKKSNRTLLMRSDNCGIVGLCAIANSFIFWYPPFNFVGCRVVHRKVRTLNCVSLFKIRRGKIWSHCRFGSKTDVRWKWIDVTQSIISWNVFNIFLDSFLTFFLEKFSFYWVLYCHTGKLVQPKKLRVKTDLWEIVFSSVFDNRFCKSAY